MFSQTAEYALRAIVWLAANADKTPASHVKIAEETQVPATYLAKILQQLTAAGFVASKRGVGGGFQLLCDAAETTVFDIIDAVDPIRRFDDCPLRLKTHRKKRCPMHASLDEAAEQVEQALSRHTIEDLLADPARPIPLVDSVRRKR